MKYLSAFITLLIIILSCEPIGKNPDSVEPGMTKSKVQNLLGLPDRVDSIEKDSEIIWGAEEMFWDQLTMGTRLEIWIYEAEENEIRLYFLDGGDTLEYRIVAPKNAVYETVD